MSDNVVPLSDNVVSADFPARYDQLDDLLKSIKDLIYTYAGRVPVATVLGVLRIIEHDLIRDLRDDQP